MAMRDLMDTASTGRENGTGRTIGEEPQPGAPDWWDDFARTVENPRASVYDFLRTSILKGLELDGANGVGDARSLARLYAACVSEVDGIRLVTPGSVDDALVERSSGTPDHSSTLSSPPRMWNVPTVTSPSGPFTPAW